MARLRDEKILITGPAGQIAFPLAARLARDNEVWGLARFGDPRQRERVEKPVRPRKPAGQKILLDDVEDHEHHVDRREQQGDGRHERQRRQHD